ncbi:ATP-binding cassette domain-containing protein [Alphaproteobacteria bacterium GH1-50]|uniref:ATP-binding cassette domain-containing protein n=1 Tax=Kangsaoukella pontilimi TaxID=2691042 RepID=A0A7C9IFF3_9RHOB|nr:CpaF family protein [Kangsaoukella pontilimi]MXQ07524.1 ATP-binding cassette domain-containing protein [Kangsaoukella pontilimi]
MFKSFGKTDKAAATGNGTVVNMDQAAAQVTSQALRSLTNTDKELTDRLELKTRLHEALLERLNLSVIDKVATDELRREVANLAQVVLAEEKRPMRTEDFKKIVDELMDEVLGYGPLEPLLADPTINDILVNAHDKVYVERFGILEKANVRFRDERHLLRIIDKIVSSIGRRVDESQPWVDARLPDGSRVNAIIRPCAIDGPSLSIRKFSKKPILLEKMIELGSLSEPAAALLKALVEARMNILISGGTGSGKTTLLNAMSRSISPNERIVTIEDAAELQLQQEHVVRLETRPPNPNGAGAIFQRDLVKNALRMRPDRIIVGEVRGAETFDMLQAMNTGHDGSMTTVHANTARDALSRLEQMVSMMGMELPLSAVRSQIAAGINVVVQLNRLSDGNRKVVSVSEITGMEGETITMQDIFVFKKTGKGPNGEVLGDFIATGMRPKCAEQLLAAGVDLSQTNFLSRGA